MRWTGPRAASPATGSACSATANRSTTSPASGSPSSIRATFSAPWSSSKNIQTRRIYKLRETASVKIERVEPIAVAFPMKKPVFMAGVEIRQADNVVVRIESDTGVVGWGEAASAPTMTGETVESMMAAISYISPAVLGREAEDIAGASAAMNIRMYGNQAAKAAIEIALHDLIGRATGAPAYALLGGKRRSRIAVLGVISNGEIAADLRDAAAKKADGFTAFKI